MDTPDLSLVPTDQLVAELLNRAEHGVVALMHIVVEKEGHGDYRLIRDWKGNSLTCLGITSAAADSILQHIKDQGAGQESYEF